MVQRRIGKGSTVGIMVRLPEDLRDRIRSAAETSNRSMNSEIVGTLERAYPVAMMTASQLLKAMTESVPSTSHKSEAEKAHFEEFLGMLERMVDDDPNYPLVPVPANRNRPQKPEPGFSKDSAEVSKLIVGIAGDQMDRYPGEPPPTVIDVLDLVEEELDRPLSGRNFPHHDATRRALLIGARDALIERAKSEPDMPAVRESTRRAATRRAARDHVPGDPEGE